MIGEHMMDISTVWAVLVDFFGDARLHVLVGLIGLDFALGVAQAIKEKQFDWSKLAQFYGTNIAPKLLGYLSLYVTFNVLPEVSGIVKESLTSISFGVIAAEQASSIYGHLRAIGVNPAVEE